MITHTLRLGQSFSRADCLFKTKAWAKKSKSFTIERIIRYNYSVTTKHKNYFNFLVVYYSGKYEGKYQIPDGEISSQYGAHGYKHHKNRGARTKLVKND